MLNLDLELSDHVNNNQCANDQNSIKCSMNFVSSRLNMKSVFEAVTLMLVFSLL